MTKLQIPISKQISMTKYSKKKTLGFRTWTLLGHWSLVIGVLAIFFISLPAHAAILPCGTPPPAGFVGPPAPGSGSEPCTVGHIFILLVRIYNFLLSLAAVVAILFLIWGGVKMLVYQYDEHPEQFLEGAKLTVTRAITGLIIIALAYLIVYTLLRVVLGLEEGKVQNILQGTVFN